LPCKIISYDQSKRTFRISIDGFTDGATNGISAKIAYPLGFDDRDTEIKTDVVANADAWCFFEGNDMAVPVVFAWMTHSGAATTDATNRIRQENIEILATQKIKLSVGSSSIEMSANGDVSIDCGNLTISAQTTSVTGTQVNVNAVLTATKVKQGGIELGTHTHPVSGVKAGGDTAVTSPPS
jgi:ketosteroid isomerase-like protein